MTREEGLQRLQAAMQVGHDGVFVVVSDQPPRLGGTSIPLDRLLSDGEIGGQLDAAAADAPVEVLAPRGVTDDALRALNHRRDQLRADRAVVLVFYPSDCVRVSRVADDLWKWAAIVELDPPVKTWEHRRARGVVEADRYAPPLDPKVVVDLEQPLSASSTESDP